MNSAKPLPEMPLSVPLDQESQPSLSLSAPLLVVEECLDSGRTHGIVEFVAFEN